MPLRDEPQIKTIPDLLKLVLNKFILSGEMPSSVKFFGGWYIFSEILSPLIVGNAEILAVSSQPSTLKFNFPSCGISYTLGSSPHSVFRVWIKGFIKSSGIEPVR